MNSENLRKLFGRINRLKERLDIKDGIGTGWEYTFENGEIHKYNLKGIKSPEEIEDDIANVFVWLWSLKDYIAKCMESKDRIEAQVNTNPYLSVCADLANGLKHGSSGRKSRSGKNPKLGKLKYRIPQAAIEKLGVGAFDINIDIKNTHLVILEMPILDENDKLIGDAFEYIDQCIIAWDSIIDRGK